MELPSGLKADSIKFMVLILIIRAKRDRVDENSKTEQKEYLKSRNSE